MRFQQPQPGTYQHNLVVAVTRVGDQISGTIGTGPRGNGLGTAFATNWFEIGLWSATNTDDAAVFSGGVTASQQLTAMFDAAVSIWNQFGDGGGMCASSGFRWVLTPIDETPEIWVGLHPRLHSVVPRGRV
jgi:hypothetical protein